MENAIGTMVLADDPTRGTIGREAVEAAIWGMPIVRVDAMREAFFRDAKARYNDIVFWSKPSDWRNQLTTPNASAYYVYFNFNTRGGPVVLELPPANGAGLAGTLLDAWQVPLVDVGPDGADAGRGGRYLLLPPEGDDEVPEGYIGVRCSTYNGYALFRAVPASGTDDDIASAIALVKRLRLYPIARAASPPPQRFVDMADRVLDGIVRYDTSYFARLARMVSEEPEQPHHAPMLARLRSLGIEKGKEFAPDAELRGVLAEAIEEAQEGFRHALTDGIRPWWPETQWGVAEVAPHAAFAPPARLGEASFYLLAVRDAEGELLRGAGAYTLRIPPNVPAEQYWAVAAYDVATAGFIRESYCVGLDSCNERVERNPDRSIDVHFGPTAPQGRKGNWIYTAPGHGWFAMFRFHRPGQALLDRTWRLPDIVRRG